MSRGGAPSRRVLAAALLVWAAAGLSAQALEVQESSGFVEALIPGLGWRQAVVGRQLPAGAVLTSWLRAKTRIGIGESILSIEPLTRLGVVSVEAGVVRLSLSAGGLSVEAKGTVCEIAFRGMTVRVESGAATLSDGVLTALSGSVTLSGAGNAPLPVPAGAILSLTARATGPVFPEKAR